MVNNFPFVRKILLSNSTIQNIFLFLSLSCPQNIHSWDHCTRESKDGLQVIQLSATANRKISLSACLASHITFLQLLSHYAMQMKVHQILQQFSSRITLKKCCTSPLASSTSTLKQFSTYFHTLDSSKYSFGWIVTPLTQLLLNVLLALALPPEI